jgi:hypothetical protein
MAAPFKLFTFNGPLWSDNHHLTCFMLSPSPDHINALLRHVLAGGVVLLHGSRQCGKTSLALESLKQQGVLYLAVSFDRFRRSMRCTADLWLAFNKSIYNAARSEGILKADASAPTAEQDWARFSLREKPYLLIDEWDLLLHADADARDSFLGGIRADVTSDSCWFSGLLLVGSHESVFVGFTPGEG